MVITARRHAPMTIGINHLSKPDLKNIRIVVNAENGNYNVRVTWIEGSMVEERSSKLENGILRSVIAAEREGKFLKFNRAISCIKPDRIDKFEYTDLKFSYEMIL